MISVLTSLLANLFLWLFAAGAAFLWWATRKNRTGRIAGFVLLAALWGLGMRPTAEALCRPFEGACKVPPIESLKRKGVQQVVVLTGGGFPERNESLASSFPHASAYRFLEGLELAARLGPDCRVIFSGSAGRSHEERATAEAMGQLAKMLDPGRQVETESRSSSTHDHPLNVRPLLAAGPFALVTSAMHMPRAAKVFKKAGLKPIPYPVDFLSTGHYQWNDWLPSAESYWVEQAALREYLAAAFYTLRGWT